MNEQNEINEPIVEVSEKTEAVSEEKEDKLLGWKPKTLLGKRVVNKEIVNIDDILGRGERILEPEIVDILFPDLEFEIIETGQSKGKFGGGRRSIWRQTQKKTKEGNKTTFSACIVVGNKNGYVGLGYGGAKETVPAKEKALKRAKLNLIRVIRGSGSWEGKSEDPHTIPFKVVGKCSSVRILLMPAPKGTGLVIEKECQKILKLAGVKDIYSRTFGKTCTKLNLARACFNALKNLSQFKTSPEDRKKLSLIEGMIGNE